MQGGDSITGFSDEERTYPPGVKTLNLKGVSV